MNNEIKYIQLSALASILSFVQNKFIEQLGSLYGMLMTTYDPEEIPLLLYLETNERELVDFVYIEKQLKTVALFSDITSGLNKYDIVCLFNHYYNVYFSFVVEIDERPITFKTFRNWFDQFKQDGPRTDMRNIPIRHPMQLFFAKSNNNINSIVANALKIISDNFNSNY